MELVLGAVFDFVFGSWIVFTAVLSCSFLCYRIGVVAVLSNTAAHSVLDLFMGGMKGVIVDVW